MRRIVLDTSVLIAGLRSSLGASFLVLRAIGDRRLRLLATPPLFLEYEDVLKRPGQLAAHHLSPDTVDAILTELAALIEPVELNFRWRPQLRDPNDEMVLEAAINGGADALVTFNIKDFSPGAERFGIGLRTPRQLLKELGS